MASRQPSLLARTLEPLAASLWILFLVWTAIVAFVWISSSGSELAQIELSMNRVQTLWIYLDHTFEIV